MKTRKKDVSITISEAQKGGEKVIVSLPASTEKRKTKRTVKKAFKAKKNKAKKNRISKKNNIKKKAKRKIKSKSKRYKAKRKTKHKAKPKKKVNKRKAKTLSSLFKELEEGNIDELKKENQVLRAQLEYERNLNKELSEKLGALDDELHNLETKLIGQEVSENLGKEATIVEKEAPKDYSLQILSVKARFLGPYEGLIEKISFVFDNNSNKKVKPYIDVEVKHDGKRTFHEAKVYRSRMEVSPGERLKSEINLFKRIPNKGIYSIHLHVYDERTHEILLSKDERILVD
jgi:hypothetical protein